MRITAIKAQAKDKTRFSVFIDGRYSFSLNASQLKTEKLSKGMDLGKEEFKRLKKLSVQGKLLNRIYRWLAIRLRSEREIDDYLKRHSTGAGEARTVKSLLAAQGYVDDGKFARAWVRSKQTLKPTSRRLLLAQLRAKGVSDKTAKEALEDEASDDAVQLDLLIKSKRRQKRYQDEQKLVAYLVRQGFSWEDIRRALKQKEPYNQL